MNGAVILGPVMFTLIPKQPATRSPASAVTEEDVAVVPDAEDPELESLTTTGTAFPDHSTICRRVRVLPPVTVTVVSVPSACRQNNVGVFTDELDETSFVQPVIRSGSLPVFVQAFASNSRLTVVAAGNVADADDVPVPLFSWIRVHATAAAGYAKTVLIVYWMLSPDTRLITACVADTPMLPAEFASNVATSSTARVAVAAIVPTT